VSAAPLADGRSATSRGAGLLDARAPALLEQPGVYLLHFERRYKHAGHYTGWASNIARRLEAHEAGRGARLLEVVTAAGIGWRLAAVYPGADRAFERRRKGRGGASRWCPVCRGELLERPAGE
jgi:predicted GIY-YIG superfamily endonuclease